MVQVVTRQERQQATRQLQTVRQQQQQLAGQQGSLTTAEAIRSGGRQGLIKRQQTGRRISSNLSNLQKQQRELSKISKLPTRAEALARFKAEFNSRIKRLRGIASRPTEKFVNLVQGLSSVDREIVDNLREGITAVRIFKEKSKEFSANLENLEAQQLEGVTQLGQVGEEQFMSVAPQPISIAPRFTPQMSVAPPPISIAPSARSVTQIKRSIKNNEPITQFEFEKLQKSNKPIDLSFIRRFGARGVQLIQKEFVDPLVERIPRKTKKVTIPERRFLPGGSGVLVPGKGFITPDEGVDQEVEIPVVSLIRGLAKIKSPIGGGDLALGLFFAPGFGSGSAAESEFVRDGLTGKSLTKAQAKKLAAKRINQFSDVLAQTKDVKIVRSSKGLPTEAELRRLTRSLIDKNRGNANDLTKLRNFYKKSGRKDLFDDIFKQEVGLPSIPKIPKKGAKIFLKEGARAKLPPPIGRVEVARPTIVGGEGATSKFAGRGAIFEKTSDVRARIGTPFEVRAKEMLKFRQELNNLQKRLSAQGLNSAQIGKQLQSLRSKQLQKAKQSQEQRLRLRQRQSSALASSTQQQQRQRLKQSLKFRSKVRTRLRRPKGILPFPLLGTTKKLKKDSKKPTLGIQKFDVFTRKFGKFKRINEKPLKKADALNVGAKRVTRSLRASFMLRPTTRKGLGTAEGSKGVFKKTKSQFRPAKSRALKGAFVEKAKFRLDSPKEKQDIKKFRRLKKPFNRRVT